MKLMAIDYGGKRVGIASTDESGRFALPRAVFPNTEMLVDKVLEFARENEVEKIILGESKNLDGEPNSIMVEILGFKKDLEEKGSMEVILHPEVFTTLEASHIQGSGAMIDASAAALILKNYIDTIE